MANRTIKTIDGTEHSGNRSAFTDYDNYVEYKNRLTQTKIYNSMIIFDSVTTTLDEIAVKTVWFIILLTLIAASIFISIEGKENLRVEFISSSSASPSSSTSSGNTSSEQTEKSERLDNGSEVMPNEGEDKEGVNATSGLLHPDKPEPSNKGENEPRVNSRSGLLPPDKAEDLKQTEKSERLDSGSEVMPNEREDKDRVDPTSGPTRTEKPENLGSPCKRGPNFRLKSTPKILPLEKPKDLGSPCKGQPKFRLKSTPRILRRDPVENGGDVITPNPSIYPLFERELQSLLDQAFIDPFTQYILQYQEDKNRAWFVQQAKTEREKRCANIEQNFQRRPKNCATLAWLKRGYNYSCPQVVVKFVENISCS